METQITFNWGSLVLGIFSCIVGLFGYIVMRITKGYDDQIKELFCRTKDLPAIRTDLDWIKKEIDKIA